MITKRPKAVEAIIEAAFEIFAENPGAPLAKIAERAGVGRATLHRHFGTRAELIFALASRATDELENIASERTRGASSYTGALKSCMEAVIELGNRQWFLVHEDLSEFTELNVKKEQQQQELRELMMQAQEEGLFPKNCPIEWVIATYDHLIFSAWTMCRDGHTTPKQAAALSWNTFVNGIGKASF